MSIKKVGFIGTGIMGSAMVRHLMKAGYELTVYNRTKARALPLIEEGAAWKDTPGECAKGQDVVITIVGYPKDVEEVYYGPNGIFEYADEGTYVVDMTTSSPDLAKKIYNSAKKKKLHAMDCPVTGGDAGAKAGTLTILAGGDREDFDALYPVFDAFGKSIVYLGEAGSGQHVKMCNQIAIAGALSGACEAICYAKAVGIDPKLMVDTISTGAASSFQLSGVAKKGMEGDYNPGFMLKHFIKDMNIADQEALAGGVKLEILEHVRDICQKLADEKHDCEGTQAFIKHYYDEI